MSTFDPTALLSKPLDEVKPPEPQPIGSYLAVLQDYTFDATKPKDGKEPTNLVKWNYQLVEALPDVDAGQLEAYLDGKTLPEKEQRPMDFYLTPNALYRLKDFGTKDCGIAEDSVANTAELLEAMKGANFIAVFTQVNNPKDPTKPYVNMTSTAPVPES